MTDAERRPMYRMTAKGLVSFARGMGGSRRAYATPANAYPAGSLAGAPVRGCDSTSENLILPSVWTCQNPTFHLVSKKLARADGVVVSHDRTKVVWCCVTKAQKSTTMAAALSFLNNTHARGCLLRDQYAREFGWYSSHEISIRIAELVPRPIATEKRNACGCCVTVPVTLSFLSFYATRTN